jgi:PKD repeat protein
MIRQLKLVMFATAVAVSVTSAQAAAYNKDLIIGFSDDNHSDVVYDLGAASTITNGQTWNLGTTGSGILSSLTLSSTYWGVIGDDLNNQKLWCSGVDDTQLRQLSGFNDLNTINNKTGDIYSGMGSAGAGNYFTIDPSLTKSWNLETTLNASGNSAWANNYANPNTYGPGTNNLYLVQGYNTDPVLLGYFTLTSGGIVTYSTNLASSTPPAPVAAFGGMPTNIFVSQSVVFTNLSTGSFTNSDWNFGDGNLITNSSGANVTNIYAIAGVYPVSLTVEGEGGSNLATSNNYIVVKPQAMLGKPVMQGGTSFIFTGTNGPAGVQYRILTATNVAQSLVNWTPVFTNTFNNDGTYGFTNASSTNKARFFRLVSP